MPPDYITIPKKFESIFRTEYKDTVLDACIRTHKITQLTYMLLNLYCIKEFESSLEKSTNSLFPFDFEINKDLISLFQMTCSIRGKGNQVKGEKVEFVNYLKSLSNSIESFEPVSSVNLPHILDDQNTEMITSIENNIRNNFDKYIVRFLKHKLDYQNCDDKTTLKTKIDSILNKIMMKKFDNSDEYYELLHKDLNFIVPNFNGNHYDNLKEKTQKYLIHMFWINRQIELYNGKLYQVIPLRNENVLKYITIGTSALIELFIKKDCSKYLNNVELYKRELWNTFTNVDLDETEIRQDIVYTFDFALKTNCFNANLQFIHPIQKEKMILVKQSRKDGRALSDEEKKIRKEQKEIRDKQFTEQQEKRKVEMKAVVSLLQDSLKEKYKTELKSLSKKEITSLVKSKYDKSQLKELKEQIVEEIDLEIERQSVKITKFKNIIKKEIELELIKLFNYKTSVPEFYYIDEKSINELESINPIFIDCGKRSLLFMKDKNNKTLDYTNKQRLRDTGRLRYQKRRENLRRTLYIEEFESELTNYTSKTTFSEQFIDFCDKKITINYIVFDKYLDSRFRKYNWYNLIGKQRADAKMIQIIRKKYKNPTLIIGDASIGISMRNFISTPNLHIKRKLKEVFPILMIDEFRTSIINYKTNKLKIGNLKYTDKTSTERKLHSVLTYKMNERLSVINRDRNAVFNIEKLFNHYLMFLRGETEFPRPKIFRR